MPLRQSLLVVLFQREMLSLLRRRGALVASAAAAASEDSFRVLQSLRARRSRGLPLRLSAFGAENKPSQQLLLCAACGGHLLIAPPPSAALAAAASAAQKQQPPRTKGEQGNVGKHLGAVTNSANTERHQQLQRQQMLLQKIQKQLEDGQWGISAFFCRHKFHSLCLGEATRCLVCRP